MGSCVLDMATRGWVFVLFVISSQVTSPFGTVTSPSEHGCMDGLRHADTDCLLIYKFKDVLTGHWNLPNLAAMECLQLSMDRQKNSLSKLSALLDSIESVKDCGEIYRNTKGRMDSGIYTIYPRASDSGNNSVPLRVFCRVKAGRAWTVIQRRQDGSVDFYNRTWEDYRRGFGNLTGEFWLGNDNIHQLTNQGRYKLHMDLEDFNGIWEYSDHACFRVENEQARYKLHVGPHNGTAHHSLCYQRGWEFEQKRCDQDRPGISCYLYKPGGFWMRRCDALNPNSFYYKKAEDCPKYSRNKKPGMDGTKFIEMMISESDNTTSSKQKYDEYCK